MFVGAVKPQLPVWLWVGSNYAMQGLFEPEEDESCGPGIAAVRSWGGRISDEWFGYTGMKWMFLELFEVKQVWASWSCISFVGCVRKELGLLYVIWKDYVLLCLIRNGASATATGAYLALPFSHGGMLESGSANKSGVGLSAVRGAHSVWGIGKCLAGMGVWMPMSFCGVVFNSCAHSPCAVGVWSCSSVCAPSATFIQQS